MFFILLVVLIVVILILIKWPKLLKATKLDNFLFKSIINNSLRPHLTKLAADCKLKEDLVAKVTTALKNLLDINVVENNFGKEISLLWRDAFKKINLAQIISDINKKIVTIKVAEIVDYVCDELILKYSEDY